MKEIANISRFLTDVEFEISNQTNVIFQSCEKLYQIKEDK